ncbi:non-ribosomal peptide synthetase, partial [Bacillus cereus]
KDVVINKINKLTPMQEGMLFTYLQEKDTTAYVLQSEFEIKGNIQLDLLNQAYNVLCNKYQILNTIVLEHWKHPAQIIVKNRELKVVYQDYSKRSHKEKIYENYVNEIVKGGFNLSKDSLFKLDLVRMSEDEFRLIVTCHHIIIDGWSNAIVLNDLFEVYKSLAAKNMNLLEDEYKYEKYIQWLENQEQEIGLEYWKEYFKDYNEEITFPSTKIGSYGYIGKELEVELDDDISRKLQNISKAHGITLSTLCQTAWAILLQKYSNVNDIVFGTVVSGRPSEIEEVDKIVGMFINTIPVRIKLDIGNTISSILEKTQKASNASKQYEHFTLSEIQKLSSLKQNFIHNLMVFENYPERETRDNEIDFMVERINGREQTSFDLNVIFMYENKLKFVLMYNENVYENGFMGRFARHLQAVLGKIANDIDLKIENIELLDIEEKNIIINKFNNTKREYPKHKTIKGIFEEEAELAGEKIAVVSNGIELSYQELNQRANQLARVLKRKGITRDSIVPILCDKSIETVVTMVAVIKAGGAYLLIDEEYPESRIRYMLQDSGSKILLAKDNQLTKLNLEGMNLELVKIDDGKELITGRNNLEDMNGPEDLAYVIYTSGSTGNPKGVCVENKSVIRLVKNQNYVELNREDKILQTGSMAFDASTFEIWGALLNGLTIHVENKELILNPNGLKQYIQENNITAMFMTTALFHQLCNIDLSTFDNIKSLLIGGDVLELSVFNNLREHNERIKFIHVYGPTENTTFSTSFLLNSGEKWDEKRTIPIGKPINNSTAYVMDRNLRLLPVGVPGELCVGGDGVARGYLNREDLTNEKFILNPYVEGERIYKTGDLARWLPDGNLEFLGRIDHQVKIRGYRIELGEIEKQLVKHFAVKEAVVIDRKSDNNEKYLCGYIVGEDDISTQEIKEELRKALPDYMIPAYIMQLEKLPLTPNGKIDKKALPEPNL